MKFNILIVLLVALSAMAYEPKVNVWTEQGMLNVNYDTESPIGIVFDSYYDLSDEGKATMNAFLKVFNEYIPITEVTNQRQELEWKETVCWGTSDFAQVCVTYGWQAVFGWRVTQNINESSKAYNISYVPFAEGGAFIDSSLSTKVARVNYQNYLYFVRAYIPTGVELFPDGTVCYDSNFRLIETEYLSHINSKLIECYEKVLDNF